MLPLDDPEAEQLLGRVPAERRGECWWLVRRDGTPVAGDRGGGVELMLALTATRPLGRVARALRLAAAVDAVDRVFARYRARLGRLVPDGQAPRRFP